MNVVGWPRRYAATRSPGELTPDQAFQLLARASMATNRKVRDIADHRDPEPTPPADR